MARTPKYGEPTVSVTIRMPVSLVEKLGSPLSENVVKALGYQRPKRVLRAREGVPKTSNMIMTEVDPTTCSHPKDRLRQVARGKRCLDCGEVFK